MMRRMDVQTWIAGIQKVDNSLEKPKKWPCVGNLAFFDDEIFGCSSPRYC